MEVDRQPHRRGCRATPGKRHLPIEHVTNVDAIESEAMLSFWSRICSSPRCLPDTRPAGTLHVRASDGWPREG
jgi:hypothetical protein